MIQPGGRDGVHVFHNGHLDEPIALTNNAGSIVWLTDYKPYGQLYGESGSVTIGNPGTTGIVWKPSFRFPGQVADSETGLHYNHWRYYQPHLGDYSQPDPLVLGSSIHPYSYAWENPQNYVDPRGLDAVLTWGAWTAAGGKSAAFALGPLPALAIGGAAVGGYLIGEHLWPSHVYPFPGPDSDYVPPGSVPNAYPLPIPPFPNAASPSRGRAEPLHPAVPVPLDISICRARTKVDKQKCFDQYDEDSKVCTKTRSRVCWESAALRQALCIRGVKSIPPLRKR